MKTSFTGKSLLVILSLLFPFIIGSSNQATFQRDYFYLSNNTTFLPGSNVTVNLYANVSGRTYFNFTLLKITDPVNFFTQLDKNSFRWQFDVWGSEKEFLLKYSKKIKDWKERLNSPRVYNRGNLDVGQINESGIYILQALYNDQVAYCGIVVSELGMVYKTTGQQVLAFTANAQSSEFENNIKYSIYNEGKLVESKFSGKDGLVLFKIDDEVDFNNNKTLLIAQTGKEIVLSNPYIYFGGGREDYSAYVYTNQPVYRPGQEVNFKAIIRKKAGNNLENVENEDFTVNIKSPKNTEVYSNTLTTNEFGSMWDSFKLDEEADLGNYQIQISKNDKYYYGNFSVEEYKKPEYSVNVETSKDQYASGDLIEGKISADYYFGSPVTKGKVTLNIYKKVYWRPWWYWSEYAWFYKGFYNDAVYNYGNRELVHQENGELNSDGKYDFSYRVENLEKGQDFVYIISAQVTDLSRRTISGSAQTFVTRGSFSLFTSPEKYFVETGEQINLKVTARDFADNPVETNFKVNIRYNGNYYDRKRASEVIETLYGETDKNGSGFVSFISSGDQKGHFNYTVTAEDDKGREITASGSFYVGDRYNYYYGRTDFGLEIVTDKDSYIKGDSLIAYIFLPHKNTDLLVSYDAKTVIDYKKYSINENSFVIREKLSDEFSPSFNLSISFLQNGQFYNASKLIGVLAKDKFLDISVTPSQEYFKPGEKAQYTLLVKDQKGNPVKNTELSFGVVDESVYAIQEDKTPNIQNFFYSPQYNYVSVYNSRQQNYFNGRSRTATYYDKHYFDEETQIDEKGKYQLFGKVKNQNGEEFENITLILSNNKRFYKSKTDNNGNYRFENIMDGNYTLFVVTSQGLAEIDGIEISSNKEYDFEININQLMEESELNIRGGRGDDVDYLLAEPEAMMEKSVMTNGSMLKETDYLEADIRSNFVDAVIWLPGIVTDSNGKAEVEFDMPDNLTTWRATVKGITAKTDVGQTVSKVITRKDLLVRMETPRFFRENDELVISTIVHNYLEQPKRTKISFEADNLVLLKSKYNTPENSVTLFNQGNDFYELEIDKNSEVRIDWQVKVEQPVGEATLLAKALTNEESDAVELKVPILPEGVKEIEGLVTDISDYNKTEFVEFIIPDDVDIRTAEFSFSVNPSIAGTMLKALDELVGYPYGCVEQTMSRFLPTIIVANTFREIDAPLKINTIEELPEMVKAGLKRLNNFQHNDGGWGWWENDKTHPYMTAYVIYGMSLAKKAGYEINESIYQNGIQNLKDQIKNYSGDEETTLAYMIYSYTTAADISGLQVNEFDDLLNVLMRKDLNSYSQSLVLLSLIKSGETNKANKLADKLLERKENSGNLTYWGGKNWHYSWQDDKVQTTAFVVKALLNAGIKNEAVTEAVRWMMLQKQGFSWRSTQETATVIFALTDYLKITKELNPDFNVIVFVNDKKVADKNFDKNDVFNNSETIKLSGLNDDILKSGENIVRIVKNGEGKVYFSGQNLYYTKNLEAAVKVNSFIIRREYFILEPHREKDRIVYSKLKFDGEIESGKDILVKTYVDAKDNGLQYFILEDMLPSGFEVVKETENYQIEGENKYQPYMDDYYYRPWRWFYADREYRDEKVAFFVTNVPEEMEFSYIIKAQIPGEYKVAPSQGYLMYYPEVGGNSGFIDVKVFE